MGIVSIGKDPFPADRCIIQSLLKLNLKPNFFFIFFRGRFKSGPSFSFTSTQGRLPCGKGESGMRLRQRIRVNVSRPGGGEETVLKTARATLRSRLLRRFVGDQYAVLVLTPVGMHVDAVEIYESHSTGPDE